MDLKWAQHWEIHHIPGVVISRADCSHYEKCSFAVQQNLPRGNLYPLPLVFSLWFLVKGNLFLCSPQWYSHKHSSLKAEQAWSLFASPGPCSCFPGLFQFPAFPLAPCMPHPPGWALCQVLWGFPFASCSSKGQSLKKQLVLFLCWMSVCGLSVCIKLLLLNK